MEVCQRQEDYITELGGDCDLIKGGGVLSRSYCKENTKPIN